MLGQAQDRGLRRCVAGPRARSHRPLRSRSVRWLMRWSLAMTGGLMLAGTLAAESSRLGGGRL